MLSITEYDDKSNYRFLEHGPNVFKEALKYILRGEDRFRRIYLFAQDEELK